MTPRTGKIKYCPRGASNRGGVDSSHRTAREEIEPKEKSKKDI
jgi:hypothetical protein